MSCGDGSGFGELKLRYELHYWQEQLELREMRLRELQCARAVQSALHAVERTLRDPSLPVSIKRTVEALRTQAHLLTSRLDALEDEAVELQRMEPACIALETRRRAEVLSKQCVAKSSALRRWPHETVERLTASYDAQHDELYAHHVALEQEVATAHLMAVDKAVTEERFLLLATACTEMARRVLGELDESLVRASMVAADFTRERELMKASAAGKRRAAGSEAVEQASTELRAAEAELRMLMRSHADTARERGDALVTLSAQQEELNMQVVRAQTERAELVERSSKLQASA